MTDLENATRRSLLMGLAAATAASAAGAQTAAENPTLIALGDALPTVKGDFVAARERLAGIVAEYAPQWPVPDEKIIRYSTGSKAYRGIDGRGIEMPWGKGGCTKVPDLGTPEVFERSYAAHMAEAQRCAKLKSKRGMKAQLAWAEKDKEALPLSRAYWAAVDRIEKASGIEAAQADKTAAREKLAAHITAIMNVEERTIEGLIIKAQALDAWSEVGAFWRGINPDAAMWADSITAAIMRQAA